MNRFKAAVHRIAVCYPSESLSRQLRLWAIAHDDCGIEPVFGRSIGEIRRSLSGAETVLVDAGNDHAQAIELFSQSVARLGSRHVAVYTEKIHEGLELFVRTQGSWLLLGPLDHWQWEDFFSSMLPPDRQASTARESDWRGPHKRLPQRTCCNDPIAHRGKGRANRSLSSMFTSRPPVDTGKQAGESNR